MRAPTITPTESCSAELRATLADQFDLDPDEIVPSLRLHAIPEWSSLEHVALMATLEDRFGVTIDGDLIRRLTSVAAIEAFLRGSDGAEQDPPEPDETDGPELHLGLDGVYVDTTAVSSIDGAQGRLLIRGYPVEEVADNATFADTVHLVLRGELPTEAERARIESALCSPERLPPVIAALIPSLADRHPLVVLRTVLSALGTAGPGAATATPDELQRTGVALVATALDVLARHTAARLGAPAPAPAHSADADSPDAGVAEWFLNRCFGSTPDPVASRAIDLAWSITADHGANASAFAARVTASTHTDLISTVIAGLTTFGGDLHGGAVEGVAAALNDIGRPDDAARWVAERRAKRIPIAGFGHRVYAVADPRTVPLRRTAEALADRTGDSSKLDVLTALIDAMAPHRRHGLDLNVDTYLAVIFDLLGFPPDHGSALYAVSRMVGWLAHVMEQRERNVLIRPRLAYHGPDRRTWPPSVARAPAIGRARLVEAVR